MKEVIFKDAQVQKGHRIKIPKAVIDTLDIKEGQKVLIKFDISKKRLIVDIEDENAD